jgi:O-antigen/teichoic acid export membrane protein
MSYKLFAQRVGLVGLTNAIINLRGLIFIPILTKTLGADAYGIWSQIIVTVSLLAPLSTLGITYAVNRFLAPEKDKKVVSSQFTAIIVTISSTSLLMSLFLYISAEPLAQAVFGGADAAPYIKLSSLLVFLTAVDNLVIDFFAGFQRVKRYSGLQLAQTFGEMILVSYFVLSDFGLFGAIVSLLLVRGIIFFVGILWISSDIGISRPDFSAFKLYLPLTIPIIPTALAYWFINLGDRYVIGYFMNSEAVGIYSACYGLGAMLGLFYAPLSGTLFPTMVRCYMANDLDGLNTYIKYSAKYYLMLAIPAVFGLSILSKSLLLTLTTPEFVGSYGVISIVALANLLYYYSLIINYILNLHKETKKASIVYMASSVINVAMNLLLVPLMGIMGAAIATLLTFAFHSLTISWLAFKKMSYEVDLIFISKSIISSIIMALGVLFLNPLGAFNITVSVIFGAAVYFVALILLRGFSMNEYRFMAGILKQKKGDIGKTE